MPELLMSPLRFTVLCKTKACNLWPESQSDRQEVKSLSEEERGVKELQGKALDWGLGRKQSNAPHTPLSHPGWGKTGRSLLQVCFWGRCPHPMPRGPSPSYLESSDLPSCSSPVSVVLKPHKAVTGTTDPAPARGCLTTLCANVCSFNPLWVLGRREGWFFFRRTVFSLEEGIGNLHL